MSKERVAELIIEQARDYAIFTLGLEGRITSWGAGCERIMGYTAKEAIGMNFAEIFTSSDRSADQPRIELEKAWREGRAEDTRWHLRKNGERFWANGVTTAFEDQDTRGLIKIVRDETRNRRADEQRILLLNELNHRINNTLVTVQSLVEQTLRETDVDRTVRENLTQRLLALSDAHKLLVAENWAGADLGPIVTQALAPYDRGHSLRIGSDSPQIRLSPSQAVSMSLVVHELTTNAVKYGALSNSEGYVTASWNLHIGDDGSRNMTFLWEEYGGPMVTPPERRGFGSRLIARSFSDDMVGKAQVEYLPAGVRCTITLRLSASTETAMLDIASEQGDAPAAGSSGS